MQEWGTKLVEKDGNDVIFGCGIARRALWCYGGSLAKTREVVHEDERSRVDEVRSREYRRNDNNDLVVSSSERSTDASEGSPSGNC